MRATVTSKPEEFQPVTISLTIESRNELLSLWHRANIGIGDLAHVASKGSLPLPTGSGSVHALWETLDRIAEAKGLVR